MDTLPSRRSIMVASTALFGTSAMPASLQSTDFTRPTRYLNYESGPVRRAIEEATSWIHGGASSEQAVAQAIFLFVRDRIKFGFAGGFWDNSASDVVEQGRGYCNTKSTLFVAMLRGAGIPARQVFVDIDAAVLDGVISTGTPYVDHSYVEVMLDGEWRATDAYIVDPKLFETAQRRLREQNKVMGYGVHATGQNHWTGTEATYSQYNLHDPRPLGTCTWGVFEDVGDFYQRVPEAWNRLNGFVRAGFRNLTRQANARLDAMRQR
jgi:transglutaminase-like putative cysteine protease